MSRGYWLLPAACRASRWSECASRERAAHSPDAPAPPHPPIVPILPARHASPRPPAAVPHFRQMFVPILPARHAVTSTPASRPSSRLPCRSPLSAGRLDDLHSFDPANMTWTRLSAANDAGRPSARSGHGFTSAGGLLYVHGGFDASGELRGPGAS